MPPRTERKRVFFVAAVALSLVASAVIAPDSPANPKASPPPSLDGSRLLLRGASKAVLDVEKLRSELGSKDPARRREAAGQFLQSAREDAPQLHDLLHRTTRVSPLEYRAVLKLIGAQLPDQKGRFKTGSADESEGPDWLEALLGVDKEKLRPFLRTAYEETLLSVVLLRALASTKHQDAAVSILRFAYRHRGAFRDECGRQIRAMGPFAVPGLLRIRALKDPEVYKMVRYAAYQLDRLDCARPDRALKQADLDLQAEILHSYGEVRDPSAVGVILSLVDSPNEKVRLASRWAILRYVSGRPPKAVKRKLKLAGGKTTDQARALYLTYRELAAHALVASLAELQTGKNEGKVFDQARKQLADEDEPRFVAEKLFAEHDKKRVHERIQGFDEALALSRRGKLDEAIQTLDKILAADPYHPSRHEMAPLYLKKGMEVEKAGKLEEAVALYTKSIHLSPTGARSKEARIRRALVEALLDGGMKRESQFQLKRALAAGESLGRARALLLEVEKKQSHRVLVVLVLALGATLTALVGLTFLRRRV
jgi:tetratricopeptide (TPR) repeat protein